jgi:hypothetical protein
MPVELFANNAQTTLNGAINTTVASLVVTSAAPFPSASSSATPQTQFRIRVEDAPAGSGINLEFMRVTDVAGTTFTVVRAQEGTTGVNHASGSAITMVATAGALANLVASPSIAKAFRGAWAATTAYVAGDIVTYAGQTWVVTSDHTSPSTFDGVNLSLLAQRGSAELLYQEATADITLTGSYQTFLTGTLDGGAAGKTCILEAWCANTNHATALSLIVSRLFYEGTTEIATCTNQIAGANGGGGPVVIRRRMAITAGTHQLDFQSLSSPTGGKLKYNNSPIFMRVIEV